MSETVQVILLDDGRVGHRRQCDALLAAVQEHLNMQVHGLTSQADAQAKLAAMRDAGVQHCWLLGAGRRSAAISRRCKQRHPGVFAVQLLDPRHKRNVFDVLIVPQHDRLSAANVITMQGSLQNMPAAAMQAAQAFWQTQWEHLPAPRWGVLLAGSERQNRQLLRFVQTHLSTHAGSALISCAPRTQGVQRWQKRLAGIAERVHWLEYSAQSTQPSAVYGVLTHSEQFFVAAESINQLSEALAARRQQPIWISHIGMSSHKRRFVERLLCTGQVQPVTEFTLKAKQRLCLEHGTQTARIAAQVVSRWQAFNAANAQPTVMHTRQL